MVCSFDPRPLSGKLLLTTTLAALATIGLQLSATLEAARPELSPPREHSIRIVALADTAGHYGIDRDGGGGFAALHSYLRLSRERLQAEGGDLMLLHVGRFSAATTPEQFEQMIDRSELQLIDALGFDAVAFSAAELELLRHSAAEESLYSLLLPLPAVSSNLRYGLWPDQQRHLVDRRKLIDRAGLHMLLLALTAGEEPLYQSYLSAAENLRLEIDRQSGHELTILLSEASPTDSPRSDDADFLEALTGIEFGIDWSFPNPGPLRTPLLIIESWSGAAMAPLPSGVRRFEQLPEGVMICRVVRGEICEIDLRFRHQQLIAVQQRTIRLNDRRMAQSTVPLESRLHLILKKACTASGLCGTVNAE